jgi:hypothetical protein
LISLSRDILLLVSQELILNMDTNSSAMFETAQSQSTSNGGQATKMTTSRDSSTGTTIPASFSTTTKSQPQTTTQDDSITSSMDIEPSTDADTITMDLEDPYSLRASKREDDDNNKRKSILKVPSHGKARRVKKYYNRQNALIDAYLNSADEEAAEAEDALQNGWKVKLAVNGSFSVNFFLFIIQMYAAVSTGSLSLFGTAADAFVSLPPQ